MKIEVLGPELKLVIDGKLKVYAQGDQVTVDDDAGRRACAHGWAADLDGNIGTAPRVPGSKGPIAIDSLDISD